MYIAVHGWGSILDSTKTATPQFALFEKKLKLEAFENCLAVPSVLSSTLINSASSSVMLFLKAHFYAAQHSFILDTSHTGVYLPYAGSLGSANLMDNFKHCTKKSWQISTWIEAKKRQTHKVRIFPDTTFQVMTLISHTKIVKLSTKRLKKFSKLDFQNSLTFVSFLFLRQTLAL